MKFWDASALVPLLIDEPSTRTLQAITARDRAMLVWWEHESSAFRQWLASNARAHWPLLRLIAHSRGSAD